MNAYRLLAADLMRRLRWRFPVLVAWTAFAGLSEGLSVVLLLPLLDRIGLGSANGGSAGARLIDKGLSLVGATHLAEILLVLVIVASLQTTLALGLNWWTVRLARSYQCRCQMQLFAAFMNAKWSFITERKAGELTNAIVTESERLGRAFTLSLSLLGSAVIVAIYIGVAAVIAWQVTLALIGFAVVIAVAMTGLYKKSFGSGATLAPLNAELQSQLEEQFAGAKFIKAGAGVDRAMALIAPLVQRLADVNAFASAIPGMVRGILEYVALIGLAGILVAASYGLGVAPGSVIIVLALFGRLFPRLTTVQSQVYSLNANVHAVEVIDRLLTAAERDAERPVDGRGPLRIAPQAALIVRDLEVELGGRLVLHRIDLTLPIPGLVAVVGGSGAGKSTLVHALLGLVEPSAGSVRLGPHDMASAPLGAWRRTIGYVPQETILFHTSIKDNLTLLNPAASQPEIEEAARRAHALEFIDLLPGGFDTVIGDHGVKLSGGQRQRLGIARALLSKPALLLMDEAMSALDAHSEAELLRTVDELRNEMGVLLVAHRLAAARHADTVCVFDKGRLVEAGPWQDLMARRGRLYALAEAQSLADGRLAAAS